MRAKLQQCLTLIEEVLAEMDGDNAEFPSELIAVIGSGICLNCGLPITEGREIRGCHESCYSRVKRAIDSGQTTDDTAVKQGILAPPQKVGRKQSSRRRES